MAEERPLTPERELLKLIEEPNAKGKFHKGGAGFKFFSLFSPAVFRARYSFLKTKFKSGFNLQKLIHLEFRVINRVLGACIFILIFYLLSNFLISMINLNKKSNLAFEIKEIAESSSLPETSLLKATSYYLERAKARDIFKMGLAGVADAEQLAKVPISKIAEAGRNLKLVGISWSRNPDAIIEDTKAKTAYFLKKGQMINDFQVKTILKDKVILSYQGEELELR